MGAERSVALCCVIVSCLRSRCGQSTTELGRNKMEGKILLLLFSCSFCSILGDSPSAYLPPHPQPAYGGYHQTYHQPYHQPYGPPPSDPPAECPKVNETECKSVDKVEFEERNIDICVLVPEKTCTDTSSVECASVTTQTCTNTPMSFCTEMEIQECKVSTEIVTATVCKAEDLEVCVDVTETACDTAEENVCHTVQDTICEDKTTVVCADKVTVGSKSECLPVYNPRYGAPSESCKEVCTEIEIDRCTKTPEEKEVTENVCEYVTEEVCKNVDEEKCIEVPTVAVAEECVVVEGSVCATTEREICTPVSRTTCASATVPACTTIPTTVCEEIEKEQQKVECGPVKIETCIEAPVTECKDVTNDVCLTIPGLECANADKEACAEPITVIGGSSVPEEVCVTEEVEVCPEEPEVADEGAAAGVYPAPQPAYGSS